MNKIDKEVKKYLKQEEEQRRKDFHIASMQNITPEGLMGALYFSQKQFKILRDNGRDRCFGVLAGGKVVEYTEMISLVSLKENPDDICPFDDAIFLGMGKFHHWRDANGNEW